MGDGPQATSATTELYHTCLSGHAIGPPLLYAMMMRNSKRKRDSCICVGAKKGSLAHWPLHSQYSILCAQHLGKSEGTNIDTSKKMKGAQKRPKKNGWAIP